jgi:glycosyltransferase involved in cell wall biosynthesis
MDILTNGFVDLSSLADGDKTEAVSPHRNGRSNGKLNGYHKKAAPRTFDAEVLRSIAWDIGESRAADSYSPQHNHVGLATVTPAGGFAHWRILPEWVNQTAVRKGDAWHHCRLVLRLYDVSLIQFNGFNAHRLQDHDLPGLCGQFFFKLPRTGSWQLAEVGFLLRGGEFIAAARSEGVSFPSDFCSPRCSHAAIMVDPREQGRAGSVPLRFEAIENLWEQERVLRERREPRLRRLRTAAFAFSSLASGQEDWLATFVSELAAGQCAQGHEAHVFVPAREHFREPREVAGVHYHPLDVRLEGSPLEQARAYSEAATARLRELPPFDLIHLHEWMTGIGGDGDHLTIRSLSSTEAIRRGDVPATKLSLEIEAAERQAARSACCVLTPDWLRDRAVAQLGLPDSRVLPFPMEGRMPNEWEATIDVGQVKMSVGFGPFDRMMLFVGPLEHAAGVDLLLEALPVLLHRSGNLRVAFVGGGMMHGHLHHRAHQLGVAHAIRVMGHVEGSALTRLLRSAEALVLPSRYRVPFDDAVIDLARRAARPVVTTHGGPGHLVRHEENGIITYDNPGSMVWALDRILSDPTHADRMGRNGARSGGHDTVVRWSDVTRRYLEICTHQFPQLTETRR